METILVYSPALAAYDLGPAHPLRPERFTLAVALMEEYGLVPAGTAAGTPPASPPDATPIRVQEPSPATDADLLRVHDAAYVEAVRDGVPSWAHDLGTGDNPVFPHMHDASALVAGATLLAVRGVTGGTIRRAFSIAGGLHHAHRGHASGFCVYNDAAVAIAWALEAHPALRIVYLDIDAHHGDGVQEAFYAEPRVLTISLHQSGRTLFPGTGWPEETGSGAGVGYAVNVPMPPGATDECYRLAFDEVVRPRVTAFCPDLVVAQCGADALHMDPLTDLGLTLTGHRDLVRSVVSIADGLCEGRLVALGGGGYSWQHAVPRAWTSAAAAFAGVKLPELLPDSWRALAARVSGIEQPFGLTEDRYDVDPRVEARLREATAASIERVRTTPVP